MFVMGKSLVKRSYSEWSPFLFRLFPHKGNVSFVRRHIGVPRFFSLTRISTLSKFVLSISLFFSLFSAIRELKSC